MKCTGIFQQTNLSIFEETKYGLPYLTNQFCSLRTMFHIVSISLPLHIMQISKA